METELKYKEMLINIIRKHIPQCTIFLFGSRVRKTHGMGSDFDIALDIGEPINRRIIGNIGEDIENSKIPFFVDVVDLHSVSKDMRQQILKEGIKWNQ